MSRFTGQSLTESREWWLARLDLVIGKLTELGKAKARSEKLYRMALSKKLLQMTEIRSGDIKTQIAKGVKEIADLRETRDIDVVLYNTCLQTIYQAKIELNVVETDYNFERRGN